jgi:hypothetical protein
MKVTREKPQSCSHKSWSILFKPYSCIFNLCNVVIISLLDFLLCLVLANYGHCLIQALKPKNYFLFIFNCGGYCLV